MARNEAGKFLRSALEAWLDFSDEVLLLDDASTDDTLMVAGEFSGVRVAHRMTPDAAWGKEASARAALWEWACGNTEAGDYILIADADQTPARDPRPLLLSQPETVAFRLFDMWSPTEYRTDGHWKAHETARLWLFKRVPEPSEGWLWPERGIHCGHAPLNYPITRFPVTAPIDFSWLHMAYSTPELRVAKHAQYASVAAQLSDFERAHADSILSPPTLAPLPFEPQYTLTLANSNGD